MLFHVVPVSIQNKPLLLNSVFARPPHRQHQDQRPLSFRPTSTVTLNGSYTHRAHILLEEPNRHQTSYLFVFVSFVALKKRILSKICIHTVLFCIIEKRSVEPCRVFLILHSRCADVHQVNVAVVPITVRRLRAIPGVTVVASSGVETPATP